MDSKQIKTFDDVWSRLPHLFKILNSFTILNLNVTDIADTIYNTDYCNIKDFKVLSLGKGDHTIFIPDNGIWKEQNNDDEIRHIIKRFMNIINKQIIDPICFLVGKIEVIPANQRNSENNNMLQLLKMKHHMFTKLYSMLGSRHQDTIIKHLIHRLTMETKHTDFKQENFDRATEYIAFTDGVYSFRAKALIPNKEAYDLLITQHCGLAYEDVKNTSVSTYEECKTFLKQIIPHEDVRHWLLRRYNRAAAGVVEKLILILHGPMGNNGKTKLLELLNKTFDSLFCKCSSALLNPETGHSKSKPNEELMSIKKALIIAFSEPDKNKQLNMSMLKEMSGGDPITGRRLFKGKEMFYAKGLINIGCNFIPHMDATDEGAFNRIRAVKFDSQFITDVKKVNEINHIYLANESISSSFDNWKFAMMKIIMEHDYDVETPDSVLEHTYAYRQREDWIRLFFDKMIVKEETMRTTYVTFPELWREFKSWKKENDVLQNITNAMFREEIKRMFPDSAYKNDTSSEGTRLRDCFVGFKIVAGDCQISHDDYD